jgi:hypothetical protein
MKKYEALAKKNQPASPAAKPTSRNGIFST